MSEVRIVLCRPSHPGNIGAAARAMKAMGLSDLRLVAPERFPAPEAEWMATHAADVLKNSVVHETLEEAIKDCIATFALSARGREWSPQVVDVRSAAARAHELGGKVAFVFGSESAGLTNEEMFACQYLVHIPATRGLTTGGGGGPAQRLRRGFQRLGAREGAGRASAGRRSTSPSPRLARSSSRRWPTSRAFMATWRKRR